MQSSVEFKKTTLDAEDDYAQIIQFCQENKGINYLKFDASILHKVNLFALPENFDFDFLNETLDIIISTLPAIKRIFANPITRIKTSSEILPVESVRVINNETVSYAAIHSELWENITKSGLKPRKLLTQDNQDNYAIYENIIFTKAIDMILRLVGKNIRLLNNIMFANRDLTFNLLERENHTSYFLSIGKLHTGYVRDYAKHSFAAEGCLDKLLFIDRVIRSRLNSPIYKYCKRSTGKFTLKKTNVFRMHKDYHRIYLMLKWLADTKQSELETDDVEDIGSVEGYGLFCSLLSLFAVGHFNFTFADNRLLDFYNLSAEATFKNWNLKIETVKSDDINAIKYTVSKDKPYSVVLLPVLDVKLGAEKLNALKEKHEADEYLLACGIMDESESVYLSIYDIDSFRRIQQILLRGMVYSDTTHDTCAFCGQPLTTCGENFECHSCRTQILSCTCPETNMPYFVTKIKNLVEKDVSDIVASRRNRPSYERLVAAKMYFRNITKIGQDLEIIWPKCNHIHNV